MARGGNSESCGAGATGAVVAHAGGEYLDRTTGRTLSDSELSFYASLGGGVAAALVGGSNNVQTNFNTGQQTGQNAVDNNYLTIRDVKAARELIAANCKTNCSSMLAAIEQTSARKGSGLEQTCQTAPEACAVTIKEIVGGLKELQSDATRQAFAQTPAVLQRLVDKQVSDLEGAAKGLNYAADNAESLASVRSVINGVLLVGVGGVGLGIVTRVMMGACASGAASPSCVAATQEIAQGLIETASGVPLPTIGLSVTAAGATAQKLADLAETAKDASQLAKEIQLVRAEVAAGRAGVNGGGKVAGEIGTPLTSGGTANSATGPKLAEQLSSESLTASGANMNNIKVVAEGKVNGQVYIDTNQGARPATAANATEITLVPADRVAAREALHGNVNGNMATAHAEVGVIQQASNAGVAKGADLTLTVKGEPVCTFCRGDIPAAAEAAGLRSLTIVDQTAGITYFWKPGMTKLGRL